MQQRRLHLQCGQAVPWSLRRHLESDAGQVQQHLRHPQEGTLGEIHDKQLNLKFAGFLFQVEGVELQNPNETGPFSFVAGSPGMRGECMKGSSKVTFSIEGKEYSADIEFVGRSLSVNQGYIGGAALAVSVKKKNFLALQDQCLGRIHAFLKY